MDSEINKKFTPSLWSHRFPADVVVKKHIEFVEKASQDARSRVPCDIGVHYGPTTGQTADVFGGDSLPQGAPIHVYIHGGYWQELNRTISAYCVEPLFNAGARVVILDYDLAPKVTLTEIVEEMDAAGDFILDIAQKYNSKSIVLAGHCVGATLILTMLTSEWFKNLPEEKQRLFTGVVLISGVYDLTPILYTKHNKALQLTEREVAAYSVLNHANLLPESVKESLYFLVVYAEHDPPGFQEHSESFMKVLKDSRCKKLELLKVSNVDHFDIAEKLQDRKFLLTERTIQLLSK